MVLYGSNSSMTYCGESHVRTCGIQKLKNSLPMAATPRMASASHNLDKFEI